MQLLLILYLLFIPILVGAREHRVPAATQGNKLILAVQNTLPVDLKNVRVAVHSAPFWLEFGKTECVIEAIPGSGHADAIFEFRVLDVEDELTDSVSFIISDGYGAALGKRILKFTTFVIPKETKLSQPYPNPANPITTISFELNQPAHATLEIFNILGQRVTRLLDTHKPAGTFSVTWEGTDESGHQVASGNYIVHLTTKDDESKEVKHYNTKVLIQK